VGTPDPNKAARLRDLADRMADQIEQKRNPGVADQNPTQRRIRMIRSMAREADRLERIQAALYALADGHEAGDLPEHLTGLSTRAQIETLFLFPSYPAGGGEESAKDRKRLAKAGIDDADKYDQAAGDLSFLADQRLSGPDPGREIRDMELDLVGRDIPGYFPTPRPVVERMLEAAGIEPGMTVLEPSAGKGDIADVLREAHPEADLKVIEWNMDLRAILEAKGHPIIGLDFLGHEGWYDRIIMNPPFENGQDVDHVRHAYHCLRPGGRLVAIMCEGPFFRNDKAAAGFRAWLIAVGAENEKLPQGSFKNGDRPTGVAARLVVIDKPGQEETMPEEKAAETANEETQEAQEPQAEEPKAEESEILTCGQCGEFSPADAEGGPVCRASGEYVTHDDEACESFWRPEGLKRAVAGHPGAEARWARLRKKGMTDSELTEEVQQALRNVDGWNTPGLPPVRTSWQEELKFWYGTDTMKGEPTLAGAALVDRVRQVLEIPYPKDQEPEENAAEPEQTETRDIVAPLDEEAKAKKADEFKVLWSEKRDLEAAKKEAADDYNSQIKAVELELDKLAQQLRTGQQNLTVSVRVVHDYQAGEVVVIRADNGEELERRAMSDKERQAALPLQDSQEPAGEAEKKATCGDCDHWMTDSEGNGGCPLVSKGRLSIDPACGDFKPRAQEPAGETGETPEATEEPEPTTTENQPAPAETEKDPLVDQARAYRLKTAIKAAMEEGRVLDDGRPDPAYVRSVFPRGNEPTDEEMAAAWEAFQAEQQAREAA